MRRRGFTLIELIVVMAIIGTLLMVAYPRYLDSVDRAKLAVLQENLGVIRSALDQYRSDTGQYATTLDDLVTKRYLKRVPVDPVTESDTTWVTVAPPPETAGTGAATGAATGATTGTGTGIADVKSGAEGSARDGRVYADL